MKTFATIVAGAVIVVVAWMILVFAVRRSGQSPVGSNPPSDDVAHGLGDSSAGYSDGYDPSSTEVILPYEISRNPYKWKGHSGILDTHRAVMVMPDGSAAPVGAFFAGSIRFNKMIDEHTAVYDVLAAEMMGDSLMPDGQIAVILPSSDPPKLARLWRVLVVGQLEGTNMLGADLTVTAVKFEGYYDPPVRVEVPPESGTPASSVDSEGSPSPARPPTPSYEPTGVWPPVSRTAESITGQVILSEAGITIAGTTYPLTKERSLGSNEIESLAEAFSIASGFRAIGAGLYQTHIPASAILMNGNTICGGSQDAEWIAALTISSSAHPELNLMFLSGNVQPALNSAELEHSIRVCGTYIYERNQF